MPSVHIIVESARRVPLVRFGLTVVFALSLCGVAVCDESIGGEIDEEAGPGILARTWSLILLLYWLGGCLLYLIAFGAIAAVYRNPSILPALLTGTTPSPSATSSRAAKSSSSSSSSSSKVKSAEKVSRAESNSSGSSRSSTMDAPEQARPSTLEEDLSALTEALTAVLERCRKEGTDASGLENAAPLRSALLDAVRAFSGDEAEAPQEVKGVKEQGEQEEQAEQKDIAGGASESDGGDASPVSDNDTILRVLSALRGRSSKKRPRGAVTSAMDELDRLMQPDGKRTTVGHGGGESQYGEHARASGAAEGEVDHPEAEAAGSGDDRGDGGDGRDGDDVEEEKPAISSADASDLLSALDACTAPALAPSGGSEGEGGSGEDMPMEQSKSTAALDLFKALGAPQEEGDAGGDDDDDDDGGDDDDDDDDEEEEGDGGEEEDGEERRTPMSSESRADLLSALDAFQTSPGEASESTMDLLSALDQFKPKGDGDKEQGEDDEDDEDDEDEGNDHGDLLSALDQFKPKGDGDGDDVDAEQDGDDDGGAAREESGGDEWDLRADTSDLLSSLERFSQPPGSGSAAGDAAAAAERNVVPSVSVEDPSGADALEPVDSTADLLGALDRFLPAKAEGQPDSTASTGGGADDDDEAFDMDNTSDLLSQLDMLSGGGAGGKKKKKKSPKKIKGVKRAKKNAGGASSLMDAFASATSDGSATTLDETASGTESESDRSALLDFLGGSGAGAAPQAHLSVPGKSSGGTEEKPALSYDDFMKELRGESSSGGGSGSSASSPGDGAKRMSEEEFARYVAEKEEKRGGALVRAFGAREDMNKSGMRRAKKKTIKFGSKKACYQMEDTHYVACPYLDDESKALFCVFDGHVDKNCAEDCVKVYPEELEEALGVTTPDATDVGAVLRESFRSTDARLLEMGHEYEGATATAVYIWRTPDGSRYLQVANVGDSTAFLCRGQESCMLSLDHKVNSEEERTRMEMEGVQLTEGQSRINGLAVARALGDHFVKQRNMGMSGEPFVSEPYKIEAEDHMLIVASDGLWDIVSGQEAFDTIKSMNPENPSAMAQKLCKTATASPACTDNVTVVVVLL